MKANRKFLSNDDEAVSPVIAVILMVAITVVLAATVYVWVSGFGASSGQPARSLALMPNAAMSEAKDLNHPHATNATGDQLRNYTITSATNGLKYNDLILTLNGAPMACEDDTTGAQDAWRVMKGGDYVLSYVECTDATGVGPDALVAAGDTIQIYDDGGGLNGKTLRILDADANSVILTLTVG